MLIFATEDIFYQPYYWFKEVMSDHSLKKRCSIVIRTQHEIYFLNKLLSVYVIKIGIF